MPSSTDNHPAGGAAPSPGYEERDANTRAVLIFLVILGGVLLISALISWGMFQYFQAQSARVAPTSAFANVQEPRSGPQLQVHARQDYLEFEAQQKRTLETYAWENRSTGTVRVPIELAMQLLLKKGLPVAPGPDTQQSAQAKPSVPGGRKP